MQIRELIGQFMNKLTRNKEMGDNNVMTEF